MNIFSKVKDRVPLLKACGTYNLGLYKAGGYHRGNCPLCKDLSAKFTVNEEKQIFYCFSCQGTGDVISLVSKLSNLSQFGAVKHLNGLYTLGLDEEIKEIEGRSDMGGYIEKSPSDKGEFGATSERHESELPKELHDKLDRLFIPSEQEQLEEQMVNELRAILKPINEKYKDFFHLQLLTLCDMKDMSCESCVNSETKCKCKRAVFGYEGK